MQREIIGFNKKYKTVRVFFIGRFVGRSKRGLKCISLELITKLKVKKSTPTLDNIGLNGLFWTILEFATKIIGGSAVRFFYV